VSAPSTPQWLVVAKDATSFVLGVVGLSVQLWTDHVNPLLFGVFAALVGTPGFSAAVWLARATPPADGQPSPPVSTPSTGTDSSPSPSPSAP
jgi:hypothetical protein